MSDLTLGELEKRVLGSTREQFAASQEHNFLVWEESGTMGIEEGFQTSALGAVPDLNPQSMVRRWLVFEVRKSDRNTFKNMVTMGRTDNNDVVLKEGSVSKFHAYLSQGLSGGEYKLTDAGSRNGTSLKQGAVLAHQSVQISCGERITLGRVALRFFTPGGFHDYVDELRKDGTL